MTAPTPPEVVTPPVEPAVVPEAPAVTPAAMPPAVPVAAPPPPPAVQPVVESDPDDDEDLDDDLPKGLRQARKLRRENQSLRGREAEALRRAEAAEARVLVHDVASTHGIVDPDDLALLGSGTREELEARAAVIARKNAAAVAPPATPAVTPPPSNRPLESLTPGASPTPPAAPDNSYPDAWAATVQPRVRTS